MIQMKWYLIDNTLRNVSVRFDDYGLSKDIKISDALTFPGIFAPGICYK